MKKLYLIFTTAFFSFICSGCILPGAALFVDGGEDELQHGRAYVTFFAEPVKFSYGIIGPAFDKGWSITSGESTNPSPYSYPHARPINGMGPDFSPILCFLDPFCYVSFALSLPLVVPGLVISFFSLLSGMIGGLFAF